MKRIVAALLIALLIIPAITINCFPVKADPYYVESDFVRLQKGSKGSDVQKLQQRLIELGYLNDRADGSYGNNTKNAVSAFQEENDLEPDGVASPETQAVLFNEGALSVDGELADAFIETEIAAAPTEAPKTVQYIGNSNSKKFHYPYCSSVDDMKEKNKVPFYSRDEAISKGYVPCKRCYP